MRSSRIVYYLLLAIVGISGCASTDRRYYSAVASSAPAPIARVLPLTANPTSIATTPQPPAIIESSKPVETLELSPMPRPQPAPFVAKSDRTENRNKPAASIARTAPSVAPPPPSDNRLIELLEKDIDKAVEQPKERRRLQFSKDVVEHPRVRQFISQYSISSKSYFQTLLARSGKYMPIIARVLSEEGLPEELAYLALLESEFQVDATSQAGAVGLWQFVPSTARQYGLRIDAWVDERRDPVKSTKAAAAYLKDLHRYYGRWYLVTAAYNAGPAIIDKALQTSRASDFWGIKEKAQLSQETRNFVPKFVAVALIATNPKKYGFNNLRYDEPLEFDEVEAEGLLKFDAAAEMAEADLATIKELNPALLRNVTPPGAPGYRLRVPNGRGLVFAKAGEYQRSREAEPVRVVTHEVKRGDTLASIAARYGQAVSALMEINGLTSARLQIGQKLRVILDGLRGSLR
jgi:membrane-bound lytic murein transglycosylase D